MGLQQLGADLKRSMLQDAQGLVGAQLSGLRVNQTHCLLAPFASFLGVDTIPGGQVVLIPVPWPCTILEWSMVATVAGTFAVTIARGTAAGYPTADPIIGSSEPGLYGVALAFDTVLDGWTARTLSKGDVLVVTSSLSVVSSVQNATLALLLREG